jgi:Ca2+-transporting ATPase
MSVPEAFAQARSSREGLTEEEAAVRVEAYGPNALPEARRAGPLPLLAHQVLSPFVVVLLAAATISVMVHHYLTAFVIAVAVGVNVLIGFMQEYKAERALTSLKKLNAPKAVAVRGGIPRAVAASELVPGDVVLLEAGDAVPADGRVIESRGMEVEESILTGESLPVAKATTATERPEVPIGDRHSMAYLGTLVVGGHGSLLVTATGIETEMGRIALSLQSVQTDLSPLMREVRAFSKLIAVFAAFAVLLIITIGLARGLSLEDVVLFALGEAVSIIPEGLPAAVSIVLAVGVQRMARRHAVVRRLSAVETLGAATVICTDKTGTLTENRMKVARAYLPGHRVDLDLASRAADGGIAEAPLAMLGRISSLCHDLREEYVGEGLEVKGDPTEVALFLFASQVGTPIAERANRLGEIPFSHERKYMAVHYDGVGAGPQLYAKGAPEVILQRCSHSLEGESAVELDPPRREFYEQRASEMSGLGLRVLAFAYRDLDGHSQEIEDGAVKDLVFVGCVGMMDPPRAGVAESVRRCHAAGIRVVMLTGDHRLTAEAIARRLAILDERHPQILTGDHVEGMDDERFSKELETTNVFARVSPHVKLRVVEALKRKGNVVAVTGDGVNDSPALKRADVGIAMGISGTDVARDSSEIVLTDDNFTSIVAAVEEGRVAFQNIKRVVAFLFTTNLSEAAVLIACIAVGFPLPLLAVHIVWMNMVTAAPVVLSLSLEPRHPEILTRSPRKLNVGFISSEVKLLMVALLSVMLVGTLGLFSLKLSTDGLAGARTMAFTALVLFELANAFNCRSLGEPISRVGLFTNRYFLVGITGALILQLLAIYHPAMQAMFGTVPLNAWDWAALLFVAPWVIVAAEIQKRLAAWFGEYAKARARARAA